MRGKKQGIRRSKKNNAVSKVQEIASDDGSSKTLPPLPTEIIFDVLSRVPVEKLVQFTIVCKEWHGLIKDPQFIEFQLSRGLPCIIVQRKSYCGNGNLSRNLILISEEKQKWKFRKVRMNNKKGMRNKILGSCNGLLLVSSCKSRDLYKKSRDSYFIFNPITRESKMLPESVTDSHSEIYRGYDHSSDLAFGYDHINKKFKVIRSYKYVFEHHQYCKPYIIRKNRIISLGESSWREIILPPFNKKDGPPVFSNGAFHWMSYNNETPEPEGSKLLELDISNETFRIISGPFVKDHSDYSYFAHLIDLKESIATFLPCSSTIYRKVGKETEVEKCTLSFPGEHYQEYWLGVWNDSRYLFYAINRTYYTKDVNAHNELLLYSPESQSSSLVEVQGLHLHHFNAIMFVPSLISPNVTFSL